ncbi:MAG: hypothetical protein ACI4UF_04390 [Thermoguttaceae bacterium]
MSDIFQQQVGGDHYKRLKIQPAELFDKFPLPTMAAMAIMYVSRWRNKNGLEDLRKAVHCLQIADCQATARWELLCDFYQQFPEAEQEIIWEIADGNYCTARGLIEDLIEETNGNE